jgi:hypothetical protein
VDLPFRDWEIENFQGEIMSNYSEWISKNIDLDEISEKNYPILSSNISNKLKNSKAHTYKERVQVKYIL